MEKQSMMERQNNAPLRTSQPSVSVVKGEEGQQTLPRRPIGLTITVEKIDRVLAEVQAQIEHLRQYRVNLGVGRMRVIDMEATWRGA